MADYEICLFDEKGNEEATMQYSGYSKKEAIFLFRKKFDLIHKKLGKRLVIKKTIIRCLG